MIAIFGFPTLQIAVTAAVLTIGLTPVVRRLALVTGAVARPKAERWHRSPVPMLGGVAIFVGAALALLLGGQYTVSALPVVVAATGLFALGLVDDFAKLRPSTKLAGQIIVACVVTALGPIFALTPWHAVNVFVTIFWIVMVTNAFNLLDNMDGLCAGVAGISAVACGVALPGAWPAYAGAVAGAAAGFLVFNFKPASIFMGDGGSLFLGGTIAALTLTGDHRAVSDPLSALAVPGFLVLVPLFDTAFVTLSRILSTRSAAQGGRDHTSHRLVAMGFSDREAVLILYVISVGGGAAAVLSGHSQVYEVLLIGPLLLIGLALLGIQLAKVQVYDGDDFSVLLQRPYSQLLLDVTYRRRVFEMVLDVALITFAYYGAYLIRFDEEIATYYPLFERSLPIVLACQLSSFFIAGVYRRTWQHVSLTDLSTYAKAVGLAVLSCVMMLVYLYRFEEYSRGVFVIDAMMLCLLLPGSRLSVRVLGETGRRHRRTGRRALIYGAGDGGALVVRELRNNTRYGYQPVAFLDDDVSKCGKRVLGLPVIGGADALEEAVADLEAVVVIVSSTKLGLERLDQVRGVCIASGTELLQLRFALDELPEAATPV